MLHCCPSGSQHLSELILPQPSLFRCFHRKQTGCEPQSELQWHHPSPHLEMVVSQGGFGEEEGEMWKFTQQIRKGKMCTAYNISVNPQAGKQQNGREDKDLEEVLFHQKTPIINSRIRACCFHFSSVSNKEFILLSYHLKHTLFNQNPP